MKSLATSPKGRRLLFYLLYISEGAPIGFIWWALPTQLKVAGVNVADIAELSALLVIPWTLKIVWAPFVDVLQFRKWNLRNWIVFCQIGMGLTLLPLAYLNLATDLGLIKILLFTHAIIAATQDVAIDSWAIKTTASEERGRINGYMQMGMLSGRWLFSSGFLIFASIFTTKVLVLSLSGLIWFLSLVVLVSPDPDLVITKTQPIVARLKDFVLLLKRVFSRKKTWAGIGFSLLAGAGLHAATSVLGPFLIDHGLTEEQVGHFFSFNIIGLFAGSFLGGIIADKWGHRKSVALFLSLIAINVLGISVVDFAMSSWAFQGALLYGLLQLLHFFIGLFTSSSYGMLMDLTEKDVSATQYSSYMGAVNACESWTGYAFAAAYRSTSSYGMSFSGFALISLLALVFLPIIKKLKQK